MTQHKQTQLEIFEHTSTRVKRGIRPHRETADKIPEFKFPTQLCIKAACLLIITIVSFGLGVERGKVVSKKKVSTRFLAAKKTPAIIKEISLKEEKIQKPTQKNKKLEKKEKTDRIQTSSYIIQVASYKKNSSYIDRELAKLKKNGYKTITISSSSGEYMGICAGKYRNKKEAQKYLRSLQRTYKDCFIRKI